MRLIKSELGKKIYVKLLEVQYGISENLSLKIYNDVVKNFEVLDITEKIKLFIKKKITENTEIRLFCMKCEVISTCLEIDKSFCCPKCLNTTFKTKICEVKHD